MTQKQTIVCIHGIARTPLSMWRIMLESWLSDYTVVGWYYPSLKHGSAEQVELLAAFLQKRFSDSTEPVHFITHSLGGYILYQYLARPDIIPVGQAVMIAPPLGGSAVIDEGIRWKVFTNFFGPVTKELQTAKAASDSPAPRTNIAVIAGSKNQWPLSQLFFNEPNDGKVSVRSTQHLPVTAHMVVPYNHTEIIYRKDVIDRALCFIETGTLE
jgi:pimeloyl-ACP methyl ester carboxylesterase